MRTHPHAEANYRVVQLSEAFGVEIDVPGTNPTTVSSFESEEAAEAWIVKTRDRIEKESTNQHWFQKRGRFNR